MSFYNLSTEEFHNQTQIDNNICAYDSSFSLNKNEFDTQAQEPEVNSFYHIFIGQEWKQEQTSSLNESLPQNYNQQIFQQQQQKQQIKQISQNSNSETTNQQLFNNQSQKSMMIQQSKCFNNNVTQTSIKKPVEKQENLRKNIYKTLCHGFYMYLNDINKEMQKNNQSEIKEQIYENIEKKFQELNIKSKDFFKKYNQKKYNNVQNLKQFLYLFFNIDLKTKRFVGYAEDILVKSKRDPSQKMFNEKQMLRCLFLKFLRNESVQYCLFQSKIKNVKDFMPLKKVIFEVFLKYNNYLI